MDTESIIEYLERHVDGNLYEHQYMRQFISYDQMKKNIKDSFDMAKKNHHFEMVELIKYTINSINKEKIISKNDYQSIAENIYNEFYNQKNQ
jgi:hypothetical protein